MNETPPNPAADTPNTTPPQPVAYDAQGRPLYAHPPQQPQPQQSQPPQPQQVIATPAPSMVQVTRPYEPEEPVLSPERKKLHDRSMKLYPSLNLSEGEYVISAVRRHPIGIILPLAVGTLLIGLALSLLVNYDLFATTFLLTGPLSEISFIMTPILVFVGVVVLAMAIAYYVYVNNKFFLTNESVIQEIQVSLFSRQEQTVSLGNIEDASFTQRGILQQILDYGDIRLSTEGDETTYRFSYVARPKDHIARLNNAVESFKLGRPVEDN